MEKKKSVAAFVAPLGKGVDKLWRIEKKLRAMFQRKKARELPVTLNLGSVQEVSRRADVAHELLRRALKRKRRSLPDHG